MLSSDAGASPHWPFEPRIDPAAFAFLRFADTSAGITRTQRENREGWFAHARRNRTFILDAAQRVKNRGAAMVLGAGKAYDLPLVELARVFDRLVLVDIDAGALSETVEAVVRDASLRAKFELRPMDVTGITSYVARRIVEAVERAAEPREAEAALEGLAASYRLAGGVRLVSPAQRVDFLVSGMLLSQIGLQAKLAAKRTFEARFGPIAPESQPRWSESWDRFEFKVQQDHIDCLTSQAELAVLSSDVVHKPMRLSRDGAELPAGVPWSVIGTPRLEHRIPAFQQIVAQASWLWRRIRARRDEDGVLTEVAAALLRENGRKG